MLNTMSDTNAAGDGAGDAVQAFDVKFEDEQCSPGFTVLFSSPGTQVKFSSSSDESEAAEAFPRETCKKLREQMRALSAENCKLRRSVEQMKQQTSASCSTAPSRGSRKVEPPRLASEVAAAQVSELSRRLRDMCAELEATRNKQRAAEDRVVSLMEEVERLRTAPPPAAPSTVGESEGAPSMEEQVRQLTERLSQTNAKLCDSRSHCAQLRRDLQLAQRALANEVGEAVTVSQLGSFRGRAQQILQLQRRVAELQEKLSQQQLPPGHTASSSSDHGVSPAQSQLLQQMEKERRAAHEQTVTALRDTQMQLEDSRRRLEGQRARTKVLEAELRDLKQKMTVLLEKGEHDNQLVAALTAQLRAAEESAQDKRTLLTVESERMRERTRQLEDELSALRGQLTSQAAQLAQKDRLAEQLQLRIDQLEQPKIEGSVCDSPRSAGSDCGSGSYHPALQAVEAERRRLLELVAVLHTRMDDREQAATQADQRWRQERARAAQLQTKVERLEVERQSLVKVGCYRGPANKQLQQQMLSIEERQRLELLEEEVALLRTRVDVLRREKEEDRAKYLSLLQRSWDQEQRSEVAPSSSYSRSPGPQRRGSVQQSCASSVVQHLPVSRRSSGSSGSGGGSSWSGSVSSSRVSRASGAARRARSQAPSAR